MYQPLTVVGHRWVTETITPQLGPQGGVVLDAHQLHPNQPQPRLATLIKSCKYYRGTLSSHLMLDGKQNLHWEMTTVQLPMQTKEKPASL
jgi:hypothetical protein